MKYNVVIVGASIAGLYSGYKLAKAGLSVAIYDRRKEIGNPVRCGEATGNRKEIERFFPYDDSYIACELKGLAVHLNGDRKVDVDMTDTGVILKREKFEQYVASLAKEAGAQINLLTNVDEIISGGEESWSSIRLESGEIIEADFIVGADGAESFVGQSVGLTKWLKPNDAFTALQYRIKSSKWNDGKMHFFVGKKEIPNGYIWVFPKDNGEVSVGAGLYGIKHKSRDKKGAKEWLHEFIEKEYPNDKPEMLISGCAPINYSPKQLVRGNVLIVGDAARVVNPLTAGGIMNALEAADIMGDSIIKAHEKKNLKHLHRYEKKWNRSPRLIQKIFYITKEIFMETSDDLIEKSLHVSYRFLAKADRSKVFSIPIGSMFEMVRLFSGKFLKRLPILWKD